MGGAAVTGQTFGGQAFKRVVDSQMYSKIVGATVRLKTHWACNMASLVFTTSPRYASYTRFMSLAF